MKDLKPRLIITDSNKSKSGFFRYLMLIIIFSAGFCMGYITAVNPLLEGYLSKKLDLNNNISERIDYIATHFNSNKSNNQIPDEPAVRHPGHRYSYTYNKNKQDSKTSTNIINSSLHDYTSTIEYKDEKYTLQLAAFETEKKAQDVVTDLHNQGYDAYAIISVNSRGNKWYLIRIGIFNTYDEAYQYSEKIFKSEGIISEIEILEPPAITKLSNFDLE